MFQKPLFKESLFLLILVAVLHTVAIKFFLYWSIFEFDSIMHFLGGMFVAVSSLWFYFYSDFFDPKSKKLKDFFVVAILTLAWVATMWEIFELLTGLTFVFWYDYPYDTTLDFIMDFLGASVACLYAYFREENFKDVFKNI